MGRVKRRDSARSCLVRELLLLPGMQRISLGLLVGLAVAFQINCGSVTGDGSGSGGTGGGQSGGSDQTGKGGTGGGNAGTHGGSGGQAGAGATSGSGGQGGDVIGSGGAGGKHASGGAGGHASGGAGGHASGGAAGGGAGAGGPAGSAGGGGAGGKAATGGHGGGGHGGQTVDSGVTCAELVHEYSAALPAAEACTSGAANQCQQLVPLTLSICTGCDHYVTNATTLNAIRAQWTNQGCDQVGTTVCPLAAVLYINPGTAGACAGADGSPNGICGLGITTAAN